MLTIAKFSTLRKQDSTKNDLIQVKNFVSNLALKSYNLLIINTASLSVSVSMANISGFN